MHYHLMLLPPIMVIPTIKLKIVVRRR